MKQAKSFLLLFFKKAVLTLLMEQMDRFNLGRFVAAQEPVIDRVRVELQAGRKQSHWMWFIFPQLAGLGRSSMAQLYGISGLAEALAYVAHPILGPRLLECTRLVNAVPGGTAYEILGSPDDQKFRSSMTLFHAAAPQLPEFSAGLSRFFAGQGDPLTIEKLASR